MLLSNTDLPKRQQNIFARRDINTVDDVLRLIPRQYRDYRSPGSYHDVDENGYGAIVGTMMSCTKGKANNGQDYIRIKLSIDGGETINAMSFSNVYLYEKYCEYVYSRVVICGKVDYSQTFGYSISNIESIDLSANFVPHVRPIYTSLKGMSDKMLRSIINGFLEKAEEPLLVPVLDFIETIHPMYRYHSALSMLHNPVSLSSLPGAKDRLVFNDLLYFAYYLDRDDVQKYSRFGFPNRDLLQSFVKRLPYHLTNDQKHAIVNMQKEAYAGRRINALVQGDVGSGKTIVAIALMVNAYENGYQAVLTAPREVLAQQHFNEVSKYAEMLGIKTVFLRSGLKASERKSILNDIRTGKANFIVGTHACFSEAVEYDKLGLVVTDEEHLFGVKQKQALIDKAKAGVHSIAMSATPLPRTLATVLYGDDKQIIEIKEKPAGRLPVKTAIQQNREKTLPFILNEIRKGHQCYVVCPAIDDNEETDILSVETAEKEYRKYFELYGIKIGVLNGRMSKDDISAVVDSFVRKETQILISTTVIEVGVNVPNATVIVVEQAERFGLASLHQLRGRVGRSTMQSYCILVSEDVSNERLVALYNTTDGFKIAEADLKQRGTGDLIGDEQSGNNKYVDEMLLYPELFNVAKQVVKEFKYTGYLDNLIGIYAEKEEER